jgi:predicted nucleic acid-binding protein
LQTVADARATGNLVFDAQIVAVCRENGVETIWSNDRDLLRFRCVKARPLG